MSSSNTFGQNQWLVDEMYLQYKKDPNSVDPAWRALFQNGAATAVSNNDASAAPTTPETSREDASPKSDPELAGQVASEAKAARRRSEDVTSQVITPASREQVPHIERSGDTAPIYARSAAKAEAAESKRRQKSPLSRIADAPKPGTQPIRGMFKAIAKNMEESLELPTATTVRDMPARLLFENRAIINDHLKRTRGGKISFTHLIGYAIIKATQIHPDMNNHYVVEDGKPKLVVPDHINLGLAIDVHKKNGSRALVVAAIKECEQKNFAEFLESYEDIVARSRTDELTLEDYQGVTISLTNPGGFGTRHSIPRLTKNLGTIIGVGAMDYPAEFAGASDDRLAEMGVGKLVTLTSTYDHRIIQGAVSGEFLRTLSQLFVDDAFWDGIFADMEIPYQPMRWAQDTTNAGIDKSTRVMNLIEDYRSRGHLIADTNPLHWHQPGMPVPDHSDLDLATHGLTLWDLDRTFHVGGFGGQETMTLREVLKRLRSAYTLKVGYEYMHILDREERKWLQERIEAGQPKLTPAGQKYLVQQLNAAEAFENFLQTKYVGQKRFSLEGGEALIPLLDSAIDTAAGQGLDEVVLGMPHRGRLNVLHNIVGKPLAQIFNEFEGSFVGGQDGGSGDAKYHLGAEGTHYQMFGDGEIKVTLTANPSHLEAVNPVVAGITRARQDILDKGKDGYTVYPILLHGDASFAGLGIVQETLNMSQLRGFTVGGALHVVVNNQIGFTTTPDSGRSSHYATDLAKGYGCPVFHVNGDDPEAVVWVAQLATDYRRRFGKDVFIDLICYRLRGHNEADDPSVTQPQMYELIENRPTVRESYTTSLIGRGDLSAEDAEAVERDFHDQMESVFNEVKAEGKKEVAEQTGITSSQQLPHGLETNITREELLEIGEAYSALPDGFTAHQRVVPVGERRLQAVKEGGIDWAWAELIAMSSLANAGKTVRMTGEDTRRGTFTQRHAILFDPTTGDEFNPLHELAQAKGKGGKFMIYNSPLSEFGGMGFEYGYSVGDPHAVVAWEAQFGDFANGAQTILDEYVSSGEAKWGQLSKLILLLPHGYEGQGPDHSSARIERFLQMSAEGTWTVTQPTEPANYFHLLRRHVLGGLSRPLVVFTPKSMLRMKAATSSVEDFTEVKKFRSVINDPTVKDPSKVRIIQLVSGKVYYELAKRKEKDGRDDVAIVRVEMLHPVPFNRLKEAFDSYPNAEEIRFVQEEPANQGPWPFYNEQLRELIPDLLPLKRVSRRAQASTSTGISKVHTLEQKDLIERAFAE